MHRHQGVNGTGGGAVILWRNEDQDTAGVLFLFYGAVWLSGNALASINAVALRQTRLVPGWVTVCGR